MRKTSITYVIIAALAPLALFACADPLPPEVPPAPTAPPDADIPDKDPTKGNIVLDQKISELCNIPTAQFDFDSTALSPSAKEALDALATCFTTGPAKDKGMRIVGHADPRGEPQYNMGLGQRRAGNVEQFLTTRNVPATRIESSSRGELSATGTDEASWARDRKVEISMAE